MAARLSGLGCGQARRRAAELLQQFGLGEAARRRVAAYSGGMRRRLDLAASLVTEPSVIFLDEPTTGLDLPGRLVLWQVITQLSRSGRDGLPHHPVPGGSRPLADRIAVIDGRVIAEGNPAELKRQVAAQRLELTLTGAAAFEQVTRAAGNRVIYAERGSLSMGIATEGTAAQVRALLDELDPGRCAVATFSVRGATLDDVFLTLAGHASQEVRTGHPSGRAAQQTETTGV